MGLERPCTDVRRWVIGPERPRVDGESAPNGRMGWGTGLEWPDGCGEWAWNGHTDVGGPLQPTPRTPPPHPPEVGSAPILPEVEHPPNPKGWPCYPHPPRWASPQVLRWFILFFRVSVPNLRNHHRFLSPQQF